MLGGGGGDYWGHVEGAMLVSRGAMLRGLC